MRDPHFNMPVILVIDDEPEQLDTVREALGDIHYEVHTVASAERARTAARELIPDLIICDINLGGEDGLELVEDFKEEIGLGDIPVMFLSGATIPNVIRRSHEVGGHYYLRKPFDPPVLLELVDKALWMPHLVESRME